MIAPNRSARSGLPLHNLWARTRDGFSSPEVLELMGGELGLSGGVLDVAVPEPFLDRPSVVPAAGEREAAGAAPPCCMDRSGRVGERPVP